METSSWILNTYYVEFVPPHTDRFNGLKEDRTDKEALSLWSSKSDCFNDVKSCIPMRGREPPRRRESKHKTNVVSSIYKFHISYFSWVLARGPKLLLLLHISSSSRKKRENETRTMNKLKGQDILPTQMKHESKSPLFCFSVFHSKSTPCYNKTSKAWSFACQHFRNFLGRDMNV